MIVRVFVPQYVEIDVKAVVDSLKENHAPPGETWEQVAIELAEEQVRQDLSLSPAHALRSGILLRTP